MKDTVYKYIYKKKKKEKELRQIFQLSTSVRAPLAAGSLSFQPLWIVAEHTGGVYHLYLLCFPN